MLDDYSSRRDALRNEQGVAEVSPSRCISDGRRIIAGDVAAFSRYLLPALRAKFASRGTGGEQLIEAEGRALRRW